MKVFKRKIWFLNLIVALTFVASTQACNKSEEGGGSGGEDTEQGGDTSGSPTPGPKVIGAGCGIMVVVDSQNHYLDPVAPLYGSTDEDMLEQITRCRQAAEYIFALMPTGDLCNGNNKGKQFEVREIVRRGYDDGFYDEIDRNSHFGTCSN